jgi:type IV pilus assembly protein PilE
MKTNTLHALKSRKGITLIELLIVAVIIAILGAIAIPMYTGYMQRARRTDAKTALEQVRASQEMRRAERGGYATGAGALVELRNTWGGPGTTSGDYTITIVATTTTFTGTATPNTSRQNSDGPLTINQDGLKLPAAKWIK